MNKEQVKVPKGAVQAVPPQPQPTAIQQKLSKLNTMFSLFVSEMNETVSLLLSEIQKKDELIAQLQVNYKTKEVPK